MTKVTYKPQPGDPQEVEWQGRTFKAGEAMDLDGRKSEHKGLIDLARGNPFFDVDGESSQASQKPTDGKPQTTEEYRRYAIGWINQAKSSREIEKRWKDEQDLRDELGWGTDDQNLIEPILEPKLENLKNAENHQ